MRARRIFPSVPVALACLLAVAPASPGRADERILSFHSDIAVDANGWLTVTETIRVRSEAKDIRRGIYRQFPVVFRGRDYRTVRVPFEIVGVKRDGRPEAHRTEAQGDCLRVYMGRKGAYLKPGQYTYELKYRTARQLGFHAKHDELYWHVTGTEWQFPIDRASAAVALPRGVPLDQVRHEAYTGPKGATGRDYRSQLGAEGGVLFETMRPLGVGENLSIVVTLPKGFITPPTAKQEVLWFLRDNGVILAGLVGLVVVGTYYLIAWAYVGRDPATGVISPLFEAPERLCPAAARYVLRMGYDQACFTAGVLGLAVKGYLTIEDDDGDYALAKSPQAADDGLTRVETKLAHRLFRNGKRLELHQSKHARFQDAIKGVKAVLAEEYRGRYFHANTKWFILGAALSVLTLAAVGAASAVASGTPEVPFLCVWLSFWSLGVLMLGRQVVASWRAVRSGKGVGTAANIGGAVFITLFAVPFLAAEAGVLGVIIYHTSIWLLPILLLLGLLNVWFFRLLKRPTREGRKVMDLIEGLRMYLATAERDLLNAARAPARTPELYEKLLPYAVALGVENAWAEKFDDVLSGAATAAEAGYRPRWYRGAAWSAAGATAFASSFSGPFSSAVSSASVSPGSRSGSGGRGSSGGSGGGGGGGGGGW